MIRKPLPGIPDTQWYVIYTPYICTFQTTQIVGKQTIVALITWVYKMYQTRKNQAYEKIGGHKALQVDLNVHRDMCVGNQKIPSKPGPLYRTVAGRWMIQVGRLKLPVITLIGSMYGIFLAYIGLISMVNVTGTVNNPYMDPMRVRVKTPLLGVTTSVTHSEGHFWQPHAVTPFITLGSGPILFQLEGFLMIASFVFFFCRVVLHNPKMELFQQKMAFIHPVLVVMFSAGY